MAETHREEIVALENATVARAGRPVLSNITLSVHSGDGIFIGGDNGAGKSSLLLLLAGKLHPYNNEGMRRYHWDALTGESFRAARKAICLISREEQLRLQNIHAASTVTDFLHGHLDGQDFLYRDASLAEKRVIQAAIQRFDMEPLAQRRLKTLSLGEMRLCLIARASLFERQLYLLDEIFSSLSDAVATRVKEWIQGLNPRAAVLMTGHDGDRMAEFNFNGRYIVKAGKVIGIAAASISASEPQFDRSNTAKAPFEAELLIECSNSDFYHDFNPIFKDLSFSLKAGDRVLLTGPNGSGKTTLLRIMHGDFYPAWQSGSLRFLHRLAHEEKRTLWQKVQFVAAAHFTYYPARMTVREVLASRYSGSLYDYPHDLPVAAEGVMVAFSIVDFLSRPFEQLSEGEKTRVLIARAFLLPSPVYLIDEGFIALSQRYFDAAMSYLNLLPPESAVVIAANERIAILKANPSLKLNEWRLEKGQLHRAESATLL